MKSLYLKLVTLCVVSLFASYIGLTAQMLTSPEPLRPSTDVWETIKYGEISPSLYTGTVSVNIPFYTYKDADFEIPISFSYASNGLQPNARAGSMGMGWRLNVGGCISRELKGVPDDKYSALDIGTGSYPTVKGYAFLGEASFAVNNSSIYAVGALGPFETQCVYYNYDSSGAKLFDAEPDIFHFDFMGYTGSFMLDTDGYIHVFDTNVNPNSINVEYDISFAQDKCAFIIRTGDAYRYEFDGVVGNSGLNHEYTVINDNNVILAWHLSRIVAPNGRTVSFNYNRGPYVYNYRPNSFIYNVNGNIWTGNFEDRSSATKAHVISGVHSADISSISIDGTTVVNFSYVPIVEKRRTTITESGSESITGNNVLTGISVSYGGITLRSCSMSYSYSDNPGQRRFLTSLSILGEGTYSMAYESPSSVPMYGTFMIDHWDYYNARYDANASAFLNVSTLSPDGLTETYNANNVREPSFVHAKYGILTRITYPTGGYSSFTYEPHNYSRIMKRAVQTSFEPYLTVESGIAGGVRIKSVENCSASGVTLEKRVYTYTKNGSSSGVLLHKPRYKVSYYMYGSGGYYPGYYATGHLYSNNLTRYGSTHIEYSDVIETHLDGSSIHYTFSSSEDYPDAVLYEETLDHRMPSYSAFSNITWGSTVNIGGLSNLFFLTSHQSRRGRVVRIENKDSQGVTVSSSAKGYGCLTQWDIYYYNPISSPDRIEMMGTYIARDDLVTTTSSLFFGNMSVNSAEERAYNNWYQPSITTNTDNRGLKTRTKRQYVTDDLTGMNATVYNCGIIDAPISEKVYEVDANGNETLLSQTTWTYTRPAAAAHPNLVRVSSVAVKDVRENKTMNINYLYDSYGHLLQKMDPDITFTTYIWGYGGMYPVAEIKGVTLSQVRSLSGLSGINTTPLSGSAANYESSLRAIPGVEVTTYEYTPMLGLTKVTGPDGRSESYTYNNSGKLRHVLDDLLQRVSANYYSADLESSAVNSNN